MTNQCDISELKHQIQEKFLASVDKFVWTFPDEPTEGFGTSYLTFLRNYYRAVSGEWAIGSNGSLWFAGETIYSVPRVDTTDLKYQKKEQYRLIKTSQAIYDKRKAAIDALPIPTAIRTVFDNRTAEREQARCEALQAKLTGKLMPGTIVVTGKSERPWWKFWA